MDSRGTFLPPALAQLVESSAQSHTLERELYELFVRGRRRITIGLGPGVDLPLLKEELDTTGMQLTDRDLVVAIIRAEPEGYVVERPVTNFGTYIRRPNNWVSVNQGTEVRDLAAGTVLGLGSTPADAVKLTLPDGPWLVSVHGHRSARHAQFDSRPSEPPRPSPSARPTPDPRSERGFHVPSPATAPAGFRLPDAPPRSTATPVTPPTLGPNAAYRTDRSATGRTNPGIGRTIPPGVRATPPGVDRAEPPVRQPPTLTSREYEPLVRVALLHWKYGLVTLGGDPTSVVHFPDPSLARLRAAILRNVDQPERGYELFVKESDPDFWVLPRGEGVQWLTRGGTLRLKGPGHRIGFGRWAIDLPAPAVVTPRFGPRAVLSMEDVAAVMELSVEQLSDADLVKAQHRELARRFHPDRTKGDPGGISRFVEIQQAFDAWKGR